MELGGRCEDSSIERNKVLSIPKGCRSIKGRANWGRSDRIGPGTQQLAGNAWRILKPVASPCWRSQRRRRPWLATAGRGSTRPLCRIAREPLWGPQGMEQTADAQSRDRARGTLAGARGEHLCRCRTGAGSHLGQPDCLPGCPTRNSPARAATRSTRLAPDPYEPGCYDCHGDTNQDQNAFNDKVRMTAVSAATAVRVRSARILLSWVSTSTSTRAWAAWTAIIKKRCTAMAGLMPLCRSPEL